MAKKIIRIFGVPMDLGQGRRGVDMGPSAVRYAGLQKRLERLGYEVVDSGNIIVHQAEELEDEAEASDFVGLAHYLPEVGQVCRQIYDATRACARKQEHFIFVGGDHSISIGTVSGMVDEDEPLGLIWIDAHGDFNTPATSPSGNVHGMPVAALLGMGPDILSRIGDKYPKLKPEQVVMLGIRDLDDSERRNLRAAGIKVYTMRDIDEHGVASITRQTLVHLSKYKTLHVSFRFGFFRARNCPGGGYTRSRWFDLS